MALTDRHCRYLMRLISKRTVLYTEMISCNGLIRGDYERLLRFDAQEHPVSLQIGGANPHDVERAAQLGRKAGYQEINLNAGCPSKKTTAYGIGACMMADPKRVAECVRAMNPSHGLVSVKCRVGIDELDSDEFLLDFAAHVWEAGCTLLIVHARKAWLSGVSPKRNRTLPTLNYERVYRLKKDLPQLRVVINGGIDTLEACERHLKHVDGVMLGRYAYAHPMILSATDSRFYGEKNIKRVPSPEDLLHTLLPYLKRIENGNIHSVLRHALGLYRSTAGARMARRLLASVRTLRELEDFLKMRAQLKETELVPSL